MDTTEDKRASVTELTAQIAAAYVANNPLALSDITAMISTVHQALRQQTEAPAATIESKPVPRVPIKRSVTPGYLICLEDGLHCTMLKRHLRTRHSLTPDEYRAKWGLARDYPMVAPNYAESRSALARSIGLGRKREPEPAPKTAAAKSKRRKSA